MNHNFWTCSASGHSFGELALLKAEARNATIIADEAVDLMVIPQKLFENTIKVTHPLILVVVPRNHAI